MTTLRQMRFLVALADTGNFSRAAELCHVTQSTLSTGLKEMEARLGVQVAERSTHSVLMTPVGRDLAERARDILARVGDFEARAKGRGRGGRNDAALRGDPDRWAVPSAPCPADDPPRHPGMQVYLREELTEALVAGLIEGRLDLILIALPHELPPQIATHPLFEDGYSLATPRAHPLANLSLVEGPDLQGRDLSVAGARALPAAACAVEHAGRVAWRKRSFSATSLPTLVAMVEEGLGITLLPDLARDGGVARGHDLQLTALAGATPRQIALAWRNSTSHAGLYNEIGDILAAARNDLRSREP
jgi:LysR family hydrogen peroxide-inducible transcriptional activator